MNFSNRKYFGSQYVIMALPSSMPCDESPKGTCSPDEGGTGYTRHFIQRWSYVNGIEFVWMLDDNVQLCHELDVGTGKASYQPCSFTHVMDSLERVMLSEDKEEIVVRTVSDTEGTRAKISEHANDTKGPGEACPAIPDLQLLRGNASGNLPKTGRNISTVGDMCGRPNHYGVIGISRHGHGCRNNEETTKPFGVTHSVYSFCLMNVASTSSKNAWYPMKKLWQDIEFNHIVDEQGLVVCMFRKFSHSKKNLQPIRQSPAVPPPARAPCLAFEQVIDIDLTALQRKYERGPNCVNELDHHLKPLLKYLSDHVLHSIPVEKILYPTGDNGLIDAGDDGTFEIEPAMPMMDSPKIDLKPAPDSSGSILIMLLRGIQNESFGALKGVIKGKVSVDCRERVECIEKIPQCTRQQHSNRFDLRLLFVSDFDKGERQGGDRDSSTKRGCGWEAHRQMAPGAKRKGMEGQRESGAARCYYSFALLNEWDKICLQNSRIECHR